jgi:sialate O-acetylesterase
MPAHAGGLEGNRFTFRIKDRNWNSSSQQATASIRTCRSISLRTYNTIKPNVITLKFHCFMPIPGEEKDTNYDAMKSIKILSHIGTLCVTACFASVVSAQVKPSSLFSDRMVLQSGVLVPVWGMADTAEKVTIKFNGQTRSATADASGKWMVRLTKLKAGGPFEMTITGDKAGEAPIVVKDVLVGEVWLGSGQSNMDFTVAKTTKHYFAGVNNEDQEVAAANYPTIRMFTGAWKNSYEPQSDVSGTWLVVTPENVREMSAIGYLFARDMQKELKVPFGIITEAFGASTAEAWTSREALASDPRLTSLLVEFDTKAAAYKANPPDVTAALKAWEEAVAKAKADGTVAPRRPGSRNPVQDQHNPTVMYNGMIAPIIPYAIKGVLWYQGEAINGGDTGYKLYPLLQSTLIKDWRQRWGEGNLPFYICQLAPLKSWPNRPDTWYNNPDVREAQATVLSIPNTGMAVTIDIGDPVNIHPKDKQDVADRLTRIALARTYGRKIEYSGPVYDSMKIEGDVISIHFTHAAGGLVAKGGDLKTFTIAGKDGKFVPAIARIDRGALVVSSPDIAEPASVRYAWDNYPEGANLYNADGLPAAPFRTDKL